MKAPHGEKGRENTRTSEGRQPHGALAEVQQGWTVLQNPTTFLPCLIPTRAKSGAQEFIWELEAEWGETSPPLPPQRADLSPRAPGYSHSLVDSARSLRLELLSPAQNPPHTHTHSCSCNWVPLRKCGLVCRRRLSASLYPLPQWSQVSTAAVTKPRHLGLCCPVVLPEKIENIICEREDKPPYTPPACFFEQNLFHGGRMRW